jgi:hypothetical protein
MQIGDKVRVKKNQPGNCSDKGIGVAEYPNRVGVIVRQNEFGKDKFGGLWYIDLEPTARAKARTVCMFGQYLDTI